MTDERYLYTEADFDVRISPFDAIGYGNQFGWNLWNTYNDRSAGFGGPFKTKGEAYVDGVKAALAEAERLNLMA